MDEKELSETCDRVGAGWITEGKKQKYIKLKAGGVYHFVFANRGGLSICLAPSKEEKLSQIGKGTIFPEGGARMEFDGDATEYVLFPNSRKEGQENVPTMPDYILWAKKATGIVSKEEHKQEPKVEEKHGGECMEEAVEQIEEELDKDFLEYYLGASE